MGMGICLNTHPRVAQSGEQKAQGSCYWCVTILSPWNISLPLGPLECHPFGCLPLKGKRPYSHGIQRRSICSPFCVRHVCATTLMYIAPRRLHQTAVFCLI